MSRIFIYDSNYDTLRTLRCALECHGQGHEVYANVVVDPKDKRPKLVSNPVDVIGLLIHLRPFPDLVIAETGTVDGAWLCGLIYDMEMGRNCSVVLMSALVHDEKHMEKIAKLQKLYGAHFWKKPFNVNTFVEYLETFLAVSC